MKFTEIANRLNGFTLGPFGAQWTPKPPDVEIARRTIRVLEDRRILYNDCAHEDPTHCVESVLEIRRVLTEEIKCLSDSSDLLGPLRVDRMQYDRGSRIRLHYGWEGDRFYSTLGEFRGAIGPQVALLAVHYQIDVEDELAKVLPLEDAAD